jgi:hypothetical protein
MASACNSATRTAAEVMMSRLPAKGGRLSPAPSTSSMTVTTPSPISGVVFRRYPGTYAATPATASATARPIACGSGSATSA